MLMTPPIALEPYRAEAPPRTSSTEWMDGGGSSSQWIQPPNASAIGISSNTTRERLAAVEPSPRRETPSVVGVATRELGRRNNSKPGTWRSWSSSEIPAAWRNRWAFRMRVLAGLSPDASGERYAVTV